MKDTLHVLCTDEDEMASKHEMIFSLRKMMTCQTQLVPDTLPCQMMTACDEDVEEADTQEVTDISESDDEICDIGETLDYLSR